MGTKLFKKQELNQLCPRQPTLANITQTNFFKRKSCFYYSDISYSPPISGLVHLQFHTSIISRFDQCSIVAKWDWGSLKWLHKRKLRPQLSHRLISQPRLNYFLSLSFTLSSTNQSTETQFLFGMRKRKV